MVGPSAQESRGAGRKLSDFFFHRDLDVSLLYEIKIIHKSVNPTTRRQLTIVHILRTPFQTSLYAHTVSHTGEHL